MTEENTTPQEQEPEGKTLEELYAELEQPEPAPASVQAAPPADDSAILKEIQSLKAELQAEKRERLRTQDDADFKNAVAHLAKASGIKGKNVALKGFLLGKASEDPKLQTLWESRNKHPKTWEDALDILATEAKQEFLLGSDPQLEENQRAMEESQRSRSAQPPPATPQEQKLMELSDGEFEHYWMSMINRG